jgi:hypothetical protein
MFPNSDEHFGAIFRGVSNHRSFAKGFVPIAGKHPALVTIQPWNISMKRLVK